MVILKTLAGSTQQTSQRKELASNTETFETSLVPTELAIEAQRQVLSTAQNIQTNET